jgi:minichromosome maintenance protein 10
LKSDEK